MNINCNINDISDGRLYDSNDMVRVVCNDCTGCLTCCRHMGDTVVIDPYDIHRMSKKLNKTFQQLMIDTIELSMHDGVILPNMKMTGQEEKCTCLDDNNRCTIHSARPSICRLFPLGRYYENKSFKYFIYTDGCKRRNGDKIKVKKWIDTENLKENDEFIVKWHYFIKDVQNTIKSVDNESAKVITMFIINNFYVKPYDDDFYNEFDERLSEANAVLDFYNN